MNMQRFNTLILLFFLTTLMLTGSMPVFAQATGDIYLIGVVEPLNKTELPGHIDFPYYGEVMQDVLQSSPNNYIVKILDAEDLAAAGYSFSSIKNDVDLQPDQIKALCDNNRLDAILTGKITEYSREMVPRLFDPGGRRIKFTCEGILYDRDGRKIWSQSVSTDEEFKREQDQFKPPQYTQLVNVFVRDTKKLAASLIDRIGTRPTDREAPVIEFENIRSGDLVTTTCIILKGKVTDNSRVDTITVNGQNFPLRLPQKEVEMFYPVKVPMGNKGQRVVITVTAKDIYGFSHSKEYDLKWGTPIKGIVTSVNRDNLSVGLTNSDFNRTPKGLGFWVFSVDEFVDPLSSHRMRMFTADQIGPVVVVSKFPNKQVVQVQFFKGQEDLINLVKKDDILK